MMAMLSHQPYVVLDTETTGSGLDARVTEIALVRFEQGVEVARWQTLVNPGEQVTPFITRLTGISNAMLRDAPAFTEIAAELFGYIEDAILVAHNARFDYSILKNEFKRLGGVLRRRVLCTVKLSRKLYPQHRGHGLDAIMRRHGLSTDTRHRAMGDVQLVLDYLKLAQRQFGPAHVLQAATSLYQGPSLPVGLDAGFLEHIPEAPGVYLFYGDSDIPLYIGKSVNLRSRVLAHFSSDHASAKEASIAQQVTRVEWQQTAGEIGALLLESRLIKQLQPLYNSLLRQSSKLFSLRLAAGLNQVPLVSIVSRDVINPSYFDFLFGIFRTRKGAVETLRALAQEHALCLHALGLEPGKGACFAYQLHRCHGVCVGKETQAQHYARLQQALHDYRLKCWPYPGPIAIRERHDSSACTQVHVFDQWCHLGSAEDAVELDEVLQTRQDRDFDLDTYKLLQRSLNRQVGIIQLA